MHMRIMAGDKSSSNDPSQSQSAAADPAQQQSNSLMDEECKSDGSGAVKKLAKAHMSFVMPLSPYNKDNNGFFSNPGSPHNQPAAAQDVQMNEQQVAENAANLGLKSN